jgi:GAF domain-containing protein
MTDHPPTLTDIAAYAQALVNAETAVVAIAEDDGATVYYAAATGKHAAAIVNRRGNTATSGLCGVAFQGQQPVLVCQTQGDNRVRQDHAQAMGIETALAVPLLHQGQLLGALMVLNRIDGTPFDQPAEQELMEYANQVASDPGYFAVLTRDRPLANSTPVHD